MAGVGKSSLLLVTTALSTTSWGVCRLHFPGMVQMSEDRFEPAWTWAHYHKALDTLNRNNRFNESKMERVKAELWVSLSHTTLVNISYS